jgi:hypothetical protein
MATAALLRAAGSLGVTLTPDAVAALKCRSCKKGRYPPPVHMIKLTQGREIAAHVWVHPEDDDRR